MPLTAPVKTWRFAGWRLNLVLVLGTVLVTCLIVPLVTLMVNGRVGPQVLTISAACGLIIATILVLVADRIAQAHRRGLEAGIAAAQDRLSVALATARTVIWEIDLPAGAIHFDHVNLEWLGIATDAAADSMEEWIALVHPDDQPLFIQHLQATLQPGGADFALEYRMQQTAGGWGWVHSLGRVTERDAAGVPLVGVGGTINIQQRKLAEAELRGSEARLRATLAAVDEGVLLIGQDGRVLSANQRFLELWNVPQSLVLAGRDELLIGHVLDQLTDPETFMSLLNRLYLGDDEARDMLHFKDGRVLARFSRAVRMDGERCRIWCFRDVTAQTLAQAGIEASELKWRTILDSVDACIYLKDREGRYLFANQATCDLWHTRLEEVIGRSDADFFDAATARNILNNDRQVFETGEKIVREEVNQVSDTGQSVVYLSTKLPLRREDGSIYALCGISTDVTAIARLNSRLEESNRFLNALMEAIPVPIFYKDAQGRYLGVNRAYEQFLRRKRAEIIGSTVFDVAPPELAGGYDEQDKIMMQRAGTQSYETRIKDGAGEVHDVVFHKASFSDASGAVRGLIGAILDITERRMSEQSLIESEQRAQTLSTMLRMIADNAPDMIWAKDLSQRYLFANKAMCEQLLKATDTDEPIGRDDLFFAMRERSHQPDNPQWHTFGELCQDSDTLTLQRGYESHFEESGNVRGQPLFLEVRKAPMIGPNGEVMGVVGTGRDITAEREAREKLRIAALVLANSSEALMLTDAANRIVDINPAFTQLTGYTFDEAVGRDPKILQSGVQAPDFYKAMWAQIETTGRWQGEVWNRRKNGEVFIEWLTVNTLFHEDGSVHRRVGLFSDITDRKRSEELIWNQANFDNLTGLPNRRMFLDRLAQDIKKAQRGDFKLALMFLDLDRFKEVNDTLGHDLGDQLLAEAARRISACARTSDTVARIGGDEFTVILAGPTDSSGVDRMASCILASLSLPFDLGSQQSYVSVSIGVTIYPDDGTTREELLKNADQAMYVSKEGGRNRFSYFTRSMQEAAQHRMDLLNDLRGALTLDQLAVHYQPVVELKTGKVHKAEALLRWLHPVRGQVSPGEFIALAEDSGLIHDIGNWVFGRATAQAQEWRKTLHPEFQVSINLSPVQIQSNAERLDWRGHLQIAGLDGNAVVLEITEGLLLDKSPRVASELLAYRDAGIQVAIDDFGTGYSAMSYLKQLDIDYLKIDRSFVRNLGLETSDHALCQAMVVMAHTLGLKVIAEGVETRQQHDLLDAMGCDYGQGFLYARALPASEFEQWMHGGATWHG